MTRNPWHWIIDEPKFTYAEKLVALVYVRHQNRTGWAWPSPERISRLCGLSRSKVYEAITSLRSKNALRVLDEGYLTKYRVEQIQGLLFAPPDLREIDCENLVEGKSKTSGKTVDGCEKPSTTWNFRPPGGLEDRIEPEDRKPKPSRAHPARGSQLWKLDAKAKRIIAEIQYLRATTVGCGPSDLGQIEYTERRIEQLRMELGRIGCHAIEKAG